MLTRTLVAVGLLAGKGLSMPMTFGAVDVNVPAVARVYNSYFAASTLSEDIEKLDADTITIGQAVDKFNGDVNDALGIQTTSDKLLSDIKAGLANVGKLQKISLTDSMALLPIFSKFIPDTKDTLKKLKGKKAMFDKLGVTPLVLKSLNDQQKYGAKLNDAIFAKLPSLAKPVAKSQYTPIDTALKDAITAFGAGGVQPATEDGEPGAAPAEGAAPAADAGSDDS